MITDIHTHIYNEKKYQDYFIRAKGKVSKVFVMHWQKSISLEKLLQFATTKNNLYVVGSIDINNDVKKQLEIHQKLFQEKKIFGVKLYPGYQYFYPSDEKVNPITKLCQEYNKPLIIHSGSVYDTEGDAVLKYAHPIYIDELAVKFPRCKIIISHFGFPYYLETANIVDKNKNVYTDISGTIDKSNVKKSARNLFNQYIKDLQRTFSYFPDVRKKTMFGTDYSGENTPLNQVEPYIKLVGQVFSKKEKESVFCKLAEKLFLKD